MPKFKKGERVEWFGKSGEILGNVTFCNCICNRISCGYTNVATVMYDNGNYDQISMDRLRRDIAWYRDEKIKILLDEGCID